jgi:hypothetical protein
MLQSISSPRGEAASSPDPRRTKLKKAITGTILQFALGTLQLQIPSKLGLRRWQ